MEEGYEIQLIDDSRDLHRLEWAITRSSIIGLDAEWKPPSSNNSSSSSSSVTTIDHQHHPPVLLLQIACRLKNNNNSDYIVFVLDLQSAGVICSVYPLLSQVLVSPNILKLGFRFKQDLLYLSSTFRSHGYPPLVKIHPFMDISTIYTHHLNTNTNTHTYKKQPSLSFICHQLLGISLSKELQCSDWSLRPLSQQQITYAALDALSLIHIFNLFQNKLLLSQQQTLSINTKNLGFNQIPLLLTHPNHSTTNTNTILTNTFSEASHILKATLILYPQTLNLPTFNKSTIPMDYTLLHIVTQYAHKLILTHGNHPKNKPKRKSSSCKQKQKQLAAIDNWQGPPPWDSLLGGDGCPKFLCDVMIEGLAKHLRCVGIDAAVPYSRKPEPRELIDQAIREKRVVLTRDAKLLKHEYLLSNQIYRVKSLLKNDQLIEVIISLRTGMGILQLIEEVIETFELKICEDQLMSRCTKCNGRFIQKPLSIEEAVEAAKGFQVIPNCLFDRNIEFWQCTDCNQLYWEGTQYHNAVQKFIDVCKITSTD